MTHRNDGSPHTHTHDHGGEARRAAFEQLVEKHEGSFGQAFWDELYGLQDQMWTGRVNHWLPSLVSGLDPARALDVGCGEGADVIFLAEQGWTVTGIDITQVALDRASAEASARGVGDRTAFARIELTAEALDAQFELVSAHFMHTMSGDPLSLLKPLPALVQPGGRLIIVGHSVNAEEDRPHVTGWRAEDLATGLGLEDWKVEVAERRTRAGSQNPNGHQDDEVFRALRLE